MELYHTHTHTDIYIYIYIYILETCNWQTDTLSLNKIKFQTSVNVLKCLQQLTLFIETHLKANATHSNGKDALTWL